MSWGCLHFQGKTVMLIQCTTFAVGKIQKFVLFICEQAVELREKECLSFMSLCSQLYLITERMAAQHIVVYFITLSFPLFGDCNSANRIMNAYI